MTDSPFITIMMPVLNEAEQIASTLDELVSQDYPRERYEVLVVDGASTDGTVEIIDNYARKHPQVRRHHNPRVWSSAARNIAVQRARGDYLLLVDGLPVPELGEHESIVGGDTRCISIACASILAKVVRDRLMDRLDRRYPEYGWASNRGYPTGTHLAAIREHGPTAHHRATWTPILQHELRLEA